MPGPPPPSSGAIGSILSGAPGAWLMGAYALADGRTTLDLSFGTFWTLVSGSWLLDQDYQ